ncbi:2-oxoglutarate receptor 1-like [Macrobrachium rosenbergii]|uniref:2-oxoglutarate receptor 1-like n=1 Tax=Macrobrachium rosenbergii TaxID=79674 RepID=UPI0034D5BA00
MYCQHSLVGMNVPNVLCEYNDGFNNASIPYLWIRVSQVWACIVATVGISGNILTIGIIIWQMTFWRKGCITRTRSLPAVISRAKRTPLIPKEGYTLLLLNLSVCDLLYCGINLPVTVYTYSYAFTEETPSTSFCSVAAFLRYTIALMEWLSLALIALQRCVDLRRSRGVRFFKPKPTIVLIGIVWILSILPQSIFIFFTKKTLRSILYFLSRPDELIKERYRSMIKSVTLISALLLMFFICVTPVAIYSTLRIVKKETEVPLGIVIFMIYWIQYGVNFLLYIARNGNFQRAFRQVLSVPRCSSCSNDRQSPKLLHLGQRSHLISNASISTLYEYRSPMESVHLRESSDHRDRAKKELRGIHCNRLSASSLLSCNSANYDTCVSTRTNTTQVSYNTASELH